MKKYWIVWLMLGMLLLFASCGGNEEESSLVEESKQESSVAEESSVVKEESSVAEGSSVAEESSVQEEFSRAEESSQQEECSEIEKIEELASFADVVDYLEAVHGEARVDRGAYWGLCHVKLIDLDYDGVDELFCAYNADAGANSYWNEIYQYQDGKVVKILDQLGLNRGTSISPSAEFYYAKDGVYIRYGSESRYQYYTLRDGEMVPVIEEVYAWLEGGEGYVFDGQEYTKEAYESVLSERFGAAPKERYIYMAAELEGTLQPSVEDVSEGGKEELSMSEAYLQVVQNLIAEYGEGNIIENPGSKFLTDLVAVKLIDFDNDGQEELFCSFVTPELEYAAAQEQVYAHKDGEAVLIYDAVCGTRGGVYPHTWIQKTKDGIIYITKVDGQMEYYLTLKDGVFVEEHVVMLDWGSLDSDGKSYGSWNGEKMEASAFEAKYDEFWKNSHNVLHITYHNAEEFDGKFVLADTQRTIDRLYKGCGMTTEGESFTTYRDVVDYLESVHGDAHRGQPGVEGGNFMYGLCFVKLIDLDYDGTEELFVSYPLNDGVPYYINEIYQYQNEKAVMIYQRSGMNLGTSVQPRIQLIYADEGVYVRYGSQWEYEYKLLENGQMVTVVTHKEGDGPDGWQVEFNGQIYPDDASFEKAYEDFFAGAKVVTYYYELDDMGNTETMQRVSVDPV
ncbi:MAG: hypothetical protein IJ315_06060 [Firmicutes bacterium]|nr:hypothetical protein [Bacillota bacterium]